MGYDPSYHPIDLELTARVAGYIAGHGSISDLYGRAVRVARTRLQTKDWGNELIRLTHRGRSLEPFHPWLHVWGRPFLIMVEGTQAIADMVDRYLAAPDDAAVEALVNENLAVIDAGLAPRIRPQPPRASRLALEAAVRFPIERLRLAWAAATRGPARLRLGVQAARDLVQGSTTYEIVRFCSMLRPGWMDRGIVWPQALFQETAISTRNLFEPPRPILGALSLSSLDFVDTGDIPCNHTLGGYVRPYNVSAVRELIETHRPKLEHCYAHNGQPDHEVQRSVRKQCEALDDAKLRGFGFVEATDIYGPVFEPN